MELVKNKKHLVVKRDGRIESFNWKKLNKVIDWAITYKTGITDPLPFRKTILENLKIRIYDKISIVRLYDELINVVANLVSGLYPVYDTIARNLYLQKIYKETWNIKRTNGNYPDYLKVIKKGIQYNVYNKEIINSFTEKELKEIGSYIKPERDFLFTFSGLNVFMDKYATKYSKTKYLELPQHTFMRLAIQLHYKDNNRLEKIKEKYNILSQHQIAVATPFYLSALKNIFNPISCVLIQTDDDSESIMEVARSMAIFSKNGSGLGVDISKIRAIGSKIGIEGESSGVIPFVKIYEATIKAFNQLGKRPGSVAIYYPWWHYEAPEITILKDAGGTEDTRARANKYAIKLDEIFLEKVLNNEDIYLFDPKETPDLLDTYGEEFKELYEYYSNKKGIKKRKINARELYFLVAKVFVETGHLYRFFIDNANKFKASRDFINQGNLCCAEVMLPTKPLKLKKTILTDDLKEIREYDGEIGVCNLTSIDCIQFWNMLDKEKEELLYNVALGIDNAIELGSYPVKAGERFNKKHRAIGIGITNYQQWLASLGYSMEDDEAREATHQLMEDLHYFTLKASVKLARERGHYNLFEGSLWERGIFPFELYEKHFEKVEKELNITLNYPYRRDWDSLRKEVQKYGVRFEFHNSIPPGATSSLVLNFTEGIEPLQDLIVEREGTFNIKKLAPNINKYRQFYKNVFDMDYKKLLILAAIRQKFLDQGQSLNVYIKNPESATEIFNIDYLAHKLGLKSLYYAKTPKKESEEQICEGCAL